MIKITATLLLFFSSLNISVAGQNFLYFNSEPGDRMGLGQEALYTDNDLDFRVSRNIWGSSLSFTMNNFQFPGNPGSYPYVWWGLDLSAPFRSPLSVGVYEDARRYPYTQDHEPGLWFYGNGRGCNKIYGRFDVKEAIYDDIGNVISFAVDFQQHCEQQFNPPLYGSLRYNSDVPLPVLFAPQIVMNNSVNNQLCVEATSPAGATLDFSVKSSQEDISNPFEYTWSTSTGVLGSGKNFSFDLDLDVNAVVSVTLIDPESGESATSTRNICVSDTTPPTISIASPQPGQIYYGNNIMIDISIIDIVDKSINKYDLIIGNQRSIELNSDTGVSREKLSKPSPGLEPISTDIIIMARDAAWNTTVERVEILIKHDNRSE